ncbi:9347_t:CDS:2 [Racocetra fulgida]|uniref:9347_t:CDS:1 n=1 Tax=Racocetra fulgida TaxID=60492 RepID=A0A9N9F3G0_9GLOM|nr:9347_t:CDS:2 [Racocetra fulgida]
MTNSYIGHKNRDTIDQTPSSKSIKDQILPSKLNKNNDIIITDSNDDSTTNTNDQTTDNKNSNSNKNLQQKL